VESIGRYQVLGELGRGGMGAVFRARDTTSGEDVALKLLIRGRGATPQQRQRFDREARALAKVEHPNVVRLRDVGEHRGAPYLVMDFHPQGTLEASLGHALLSPSAAANIGSQLAEGLAAAHAVGILHRDLKPDNVLLGPEGQPLLTDFGLAKDLDRLGETQRLSHTGAFLGTPGFWAPEQAAGQPDEIGTAADVYGLGALLYVALTGRAPIEGSNLIEIVIATAETPPPPVRSLRPEVPPALEAIVHRCLEKDPKARWESAAALGEALRRFEAGGEDAPPARARALFAVVVGVIAAGGLLWAGWPPESSDPAPRSTPDASSASRSSEPESTLEPATTPTPEPAHPDEPEVGTEEFLLAEKALKSGRLEEGIALLRRSAEKGKPLAMFNLGVLHEAEGGGVPRDDEQAVAWYRRAAAKGLPDAMFNLGVMIADGRGAPQSYTQAAELYRRSAEKGQALAMFNLALMLDAGRGVPKDEAKATAWYRRSAKAGCVDAMVNLGNRLSLASSPPAELVEAVKWYSRASQAGDLDGVVNLGVMLSQGRGVAQNLTQAAALFRRAAEAGEPTGMFHLGTALSRGLGEAQDDARALLWFQRAATKGHAGAMNNVGIWLAKGRAVAKDEARAVTWFRQAAKRDHAQAMYNLGVSLNTGRGVPQDRAEGATWFRRAAERGFVGAMAALAYALEIGRGVAKDEAEAVKWHRLVLKKGATAHSESSQAALKRLGH
jgi:TPR repeat protein/serine/threonine protein kinase